MVHRPICGRLIVFVFAFSFLGCTSQKEHPAETVVIVKGDPMSFVAGRVLNSRPTESVDDIDTDAKYQVSSQVYLNKALASESTAQKNLARQQPASDELGRLSRLGNRYYRFEKMADGIVRLIPASGQGAGFYFKINRAGRLELVTVSTSGQAAYAASGDFQVLHYSSSPDGLKQSFLLYSASPDARALVAYTVIKSADPEVILPKSSDEYNYLYGRGVKVAWPKKKTVTLLFCEKLAPEFLYRDFEKQAAAWAEQLKNRLDFQTERSDECPPFSDVNTHTFGFVNNWVEIPGYRAGIFGTTSSILDLSRAELTDSDIVVLSREIQETLTDYYHQNNDLFADENMISPYFRTTFQQVVLHEIGHFLGLSHIFDGTPSIMSYSDQHELKDYDIQAIQALYPKLF